MAHMAVVLLLASCILLLTGSEALPAWGTKVRKQDYCAVYGVCGTNKYGPVPCPANIEAQPVYDELSPMLAAECPALFEQVEKRGNKTCCNLIELNVTMKFLDTFYSDLKSCPTCFENLKSFWCTMACSPDQSIFQIVTAVQELLPDRMDQNLWQTGIAALDVWLDPSAPEELYTSCKDVRVGDGTAMALFGNAENATEMLNTMGRSGFNGGTVPFQLNFKLEKPAHFEAGKVPLSPCEASCSCSDCPAACPT